MSGNLNSELSVATLVERICLQYVEIQRKAQPRDGETESFGDLAMPRITEFSLSL